MCLSQWPLAEISASDQEAEPQSGPLLRSSQGRGPEQNKEVCP